MSIRERPILFSGPMVRAILAGTKTQTRRIVKPQPRRAQPAFGPLYLGPDVKNDPTPYLVWQDDPESYFKVRCPYGVTGERLWVRETFRQGDGSMSVHYAADPDEVSGGPWRPSIFMPRWACRTVLEVEGVRVERLQEISEGDAKAEGVEPILTRFPSMGRDQRLTTGELAADAEHRASFAVTWDEIQLARDYRAEHDPSWKANPWVWAITFRRAS